MENSTGLGKVNGSMFGESDIGMWQALCALAVAAFGTLLAAIRWLAVSHEKQTAAHMADLKRQIDDLETRCQRCETDRAALWAEVNRLTDRAKGDAA